MTGALVVAEHRQAAHERDARRVEGHEDHRLPVIRVGVGVGDTHEHGDLAARVERAAREPLVRVDDVVVAVGLDAAADVRRVRRRDPRLRHREARSDLAFEQRSQPLLALRLGSELGEDLHVAGVGRRAVGGFAEERRATHLLTQRRVVGVREAGAVLGVGHEQVPQSALARFRLQRLHDRRREPDVARLATLVAVGRLRRTHDLIVEVAQSFEEIDRAGTGREIHGRTLPLRLFRALRASRRSRRPRPRVPSRRGSRSDRRRPRRA